MSQKPRIKKQNNAKSFTRLVICLLQVVLISVSIGVVICLLFSYNYFTSLKSFGFLAFISICYGLPIYFINHWLGRFLKIDISWIKYPIIRVIFNFLISILTFVITFIIINAVFNGIPVYTFIRKETGVIILNGHSSSTDNWVWLFCRIL